MSTCRTSFSWALPALVLVAACFFPGLAAAVPADTPPAVPRAVLLHLDSEAGDDAASGLSWDEPLRSLEEVQRRIDEGFPVAGLRLAAGWYPGALSTTRSLRVEGGYPPAGLPREGSSRLRGEPAEHRTVLDALGQAPVIRVEGGSLSLDGVVLTGGWSLEGGAVAAIDARVTVTRSELLDSGPALIGCRDCASLSVDDSLLARAATAGIELSGSQRTELSLSGSELSDQRRAVAAESPAELELRDCRLSGLEREPFALPAGSSTRLVSVDGPTGEDVPERRPTPEPARRAPAR